MLQTQINQCRTCNLSYAPAKESITKNQNFVSRFHNLEIEQCKLNI